MSWAPMRPISVRAKSHAYFRLALRQKSFKLVYAMELNKFERNTGNHLELEPDEDEEEVKEKVQETSRLNY